MVIDTTKQIIKEGVNNLIAFNIINLKDPKKMWNNLKNAYTEVG